MFWDQRGTGLSRRHPPEEITLDAYVRDLEALVDHVAPGGRRVVLLGHSWGGAYAAQYIGAHPERVAGAMLVNPQALTRALYEQNPAPAELVLRAEWVEDALFGRTLLSPDDHASADLFLVGLFATSIEALTRYHNHSDAPLFRPGAAVFVHLNQRWDEDYDFTVGLDAYPREVLIAGSSDDEVLGYDFQRRQLGFFRAARLERIEGAGHIDVFTDRVSATVGLLEDYLGELAP